MTVACECASNWRVELVELTTGSVVSVIVPVSFEFQSNFLTPGRGSITFHRKGVGNASDILVGLGSQPVYVPIFDMYPRRIGIYISRLAGGAATGLNPVPMFAGIVDSMSGAANGLVTLGFFEIQQYLNYRVIRTDLTFTAIDQTEIARQLVLYARGENTLGGSTDPDAGVDDIRLFADSNPTLGTNRDRTYKADERPTIGRMLDNLMGVIGGPVYQMSHSRSAAGVWTSTMEWYDKVPQTVIQTISAANVTDFSFALEGNELGNLIDAFGKPDPDGTPLIATDNATGSLLMSMPRYDATPGYPTVSDFNELLENAQGYAVEHLDVAAEFQFAFSGLDFTGPNGLDPLDIGDLVPGNHIYVDVISQNWRITADESLPTALTRLGSVSVSVQPEGPERVSAQVIAEGMDNIASQDGFFYPCVDC
jgi:hypothetical protein